MADYYVYLEGILFKFNMVIVGMSCIKKFFKEDNVRVIIFVLSRIVFSVVLGNFYL